MPERQVQIRVELSGLQDASAQAEKFTGEVKAVGDAAATVAVPAAAMGEAVDKAGAALSKTADAAEKTKAPIAALAADAVELTGTLRDRLGPATEAAYDAFAKLAKAETPRTMQRGILDAETALENFKKASDAAAASGEKMPARVAVAIKAMEREIETSTTKLGVLRDRMGDIAVRANAAGQSFEYLRQAGSGTTGMFSALEGSASSGVSSIGKLGLAAGGVVGALFALKEMGKAVGDSMKYVEDKESALVDLQMRHRAESEKTAAAIGAAARGNLALGGSLEDLRTHFDQAQIAMGAGSEAAIKHAAALAGINTQAEKFAEIEAKAAAMAALLSGAFARSSQEGVEMAKKNEAAIRGMEEAYRRAGEAVPESIRKAIDALNALQGAQKRAAESQAEVNKATSEFPGKVAAVGAALVKVQQDYQKEAEAARKATADVVASRDEQIAKLRDAGLSEEEYFKRKKAILAETDRLLVENATKEGAAIQRERSALADLATAYNLTGKQLEDMLQKYLAGQKAKAAAARQDEELARLQDALATSVSGYADRAGDAAAQTDALQKSLEGVGRAVDALAN